MYQLVWTLGSSMNGLSLCSSVGVINALIFLQKTTPIHGYCFSVIFLFSLTVLHFKKVVFYCLACKLLTKDFTVLQFYSLDYFSSVFLWMWKQNDKTMNYNVLLYKWNEKYHKYCCYPTLASSFISIAKDKILPKLHIWKILIIYQKYTFKESYNSTQTKVLISQNFRSNCGMDGWRGQIDYLLIVMSIDMMY